MGRNIRNVTDEANLLPVGDHESVAVAATAVGLTVPAGCTHVLYTVSGAAVRMRMDGGDPTVNSGLYLGAGASGMLRAEAARAVKFVRSTGTNGQIDSQPMAY